MTGNLTKGKFPEFNFLHIFAHNMMRGKHKSSKRFLLQGGR